LNETKTFDEIMRQTFGYYLKKRNSSYFFNCDTEGMFLCLLKESDGRGAVHGVTVNKIEMDKDFS
jgi:hypothetical protein